MLPTIVTSRPSRIQTVPSPTTIIQWKLDQGRRSRREGTRVLTVSIFGPESLIPHRQYPLAIGLCILSGVRDYSRGYRRRGGVRLHRDFEYRPQGDTRWPFRFPTFPTHTTRSSPTSTRRRCGFTTTSTTRLT